ncbi:YycH family regulatory protein [Paenibacillus cymbidii]|uniref:YycH family regulatory protein n=1 Tax=Paenibacillus cymbidii TaxID=1639034 RepID=UPI001081CD48|nr:two-component system activity regulator YycH [Paenibacillus cymbidii]
MMEKFKSFALTALVVASLVQSYFLAYSSPKFDMVTPTDYVETQLSGTQAELEEVLFPEEIVLHFGAKKHTLLPVNHQFYHMIFDDFIRKRSFEGLRKTGLIGSTVNWEDVRNNQPGFEVRFKEGIPLHALQSIVPIKEDVPLDNDLITRIWMYMNPGKEEVKTFFFTDNPQIMYEAVKADVTAKDVEKYVGLGAYLPTYHSDNGDYYLPDDPITAIAVKMAYTQFTSEQLKRSLFVDPEMTRFLLERDGTQIYTDGKKGLQIRGDQHWLSYTDPIFTSVESRSDSRENLVSAIQYINQHGGWNGTFLYSRLTPKTAVGTQTFLFRQYVDSMPIINAYPSQFGYIKVSLQKGVVSSYERSLINLDGKGAAKTDVTLPGGKALDDMLLAYGKRFNVVAVFPAYQASVIDQTVELMPRWAVELRDGTYDFL